MPQLLDPSGDDIEDTLVRLRWSQDRDESFSYYELWRDTQPNVERNVSGRLDGPPNGTPHLPTATQYSKAGTSKQVLGLAVGANRISPTFDGFFFWTAAELAGSNIVNATFMDGVVHPNPGASTMSVLGDPLEPEFTYYYRLYSINWNGEVQHSNVLSVNTKTIRARFTRTSTKELDTNAISPQTGPLAGGTTVTITGTNFVEGMKVYIGGKQAAETSRTATEIVVTSPQFVNEDFIGKQLDVVIVSPTGLKDIAIGGWTYT